MFKHLPMLNKESDPWHRQNRFVNVWVEALSDPRVTHEIRNIWISYLSQVSIITSLQIHTLFIVLRHNLIPFSRLFICKQADKSLGQKVTTRLTSKSNM